MLNHPKNTYLVQVKALSEFLPEQSDTELNRFCFAYQIVIKNIGQIAVQLIARHWLISDGHNKIQEVRGLGVVGQQPLLEPGESFEYTSGCTIETPVGTMKGEYLMVGIDGIQFDTTIEEFVLASTPQILH